MRPSAARPQEVRAFRERRHAEAVLLLRRIGRIGLALQGRQKGGNPVRGTRIDRRSPARSITILVAVLSEVSSSGRTRISQRQLGGHRLGLRGNRGTFGIVQGKASPPDSVPSSTARATCTRIQRLDDATVLHLWSARYRASCPVLKMERPRQACRPSLALDTFNVCFKGRIGKIRGHGAIFPHECSSEPERCASTRVGESGCTLARGGGRKPARGL